MIDSTIAIFMQVSRQTDDRSRNKRCPSQPTRRLSQAPYPVCHFDGARGVTADGPRNIRELIHISFETVVTISRILCWCETRIIFSTGCGDGLAMSTLRKS
jgi:hypothetical protein